MEYKIKIDMKNGQFSSFQFMTNELREEFIKEFVEPFSLEYKLFTETEDPAHTQNNLIIEKSKEKNQPKNH